MMFYELISGFEFVVIKLLVNYKIKKGGKFYFGGFWLKKIVFRNEENK